MTIDFMELENRKDQKKAKVNVIKLK